MSRDDPLVWFCAAAGVSAFSAVGALVRSKRQLTLRTIIGEAWFHLCFGAGGGMVLYELAGWQKHPWSILGIATLWGLGVISKDWIRGVLARALGLDEPREQRNQDEREE